jgi:hypothetical protein
MKDTTILILVFVTLPVSVLISYVLHKVYHKNVPPSIIGMGLVATFITVTSILNKKNNHES